MKWMWKMAVVLLAASAVAHAQSGRNMDTPMMNGSVSSMTTMYTGCIEVVNHGGMVLLTHLADDHQMTMKDAGDDRMPPRALVLTGPSNLKKQAGRKVTVTGSLSEAANETMRSDVRALRVASLKVVAKSCS